MRDSTRSPQGHLLALRLAGVCSWCHGSERHRRVHQGRRDQELHRRCRAARSAEVHGEPQARPARGASRCSAGPADHAKARADRDRRGVLRTRIADRGRPPGRRAGGDRHAGHAARPAEGDGAHRSVHTVPRRDHRGVHRRARRYHRRARCHGSRGRSDRGWLRRRGAVRAAPGVHADRTQAHDLRGPAVRIAGVPREARHANDRGRARRSRQGALPPEHALDGLDVTQRRANLRARSPGAVLE